MQLEMSLVHEGDCWVALTHANCHDQEATYLAVDGRDEVPASAILLSLDWTAEYFSESITFDGNRGGASMHPADCCHRVRAARSVRSAQWPRRLLPEQCSVTVCAWTRLR